MASRFISIEINSNNSKQANVYFNSVLVGNTVMSILLIIPSILTVLFINKIINVPAELLFDVQITFGFVFLNMILALFGNVFSVATFSKNRLELSSVRTIQGDIIRAVVILGLFTIFRPKIYFITITYIIVTAYTIFANIKFTKLLLPEISINLKNFKKSAIFKLITSGVWNSVNQLSVVLLTSLDLLLANIFISAQSSGEFAIVKTIPNFIQSFISVLVGVFVPQFTILYAQNKKKELLNNINFSIKIMGLIVTLPIGFLIVYGREFYSLWVPGENIAKLHLLSIITIVPMIITGSINTIFNVYTVTNKLKVPALVLLVTGIVNTLTVLILVSTTNLGIYAIPIVAALIGILRNTIFTPLYAAKCLNVKWNSFYIAILRGCICAFVMIAVSFFAKQFFDITSWINLILAGIISTFFTLLINVFIVFDKIEIKEYITVFKSMFYKAYNIVSFEIYCVKLKKEIKSNKDRIFLFGAPFHSNMGDQAQTFCTIKWFEKNYAQRKVFTFNTSSLTFKNYKLLSIISKLANKDDLIFLHSGYHTTDLYMLEENMQRQVIKLFKDNKIVILPQTILYQNEEESKISSEIYNNHKSLTLMCRDDYSYETANKIFTNCKLLKYPDIVTTLIGTKTFDNKREGILLCARNDKEAFYSKEILNRLKKELSTIDKVEETDTTIDLDVKYINKNREKVLNDIFDMYSKYKVIITDRYHGTIFSLISNTPVIVLSSTDHKLKSGVNWFPVEFANYVHYTEDIENVKNVVSKIYNEYFSYDLPEYFNVEYYNKLKNILENR